MTKIRKLFKGFICLGIVTAQAQQPPLSLEDCVTLAVEKNINIKQSQLDVQNAGIDQMDAFGNFLPSVNLTASHF